ncbi:MAG: DUF1501 domain-containing protein [Planctomyces sp.]|nr:DUF1501 domain-containing protein [Planctomyces sp.]
MQTSSSHGPASRNRCTHFPDRRSFVVASTAGIAGFSFGSGMAQAAAEVPQPSKAKAQSTILFFLSGGASHLDMWDMKPNAPLEYRGPFRPIATSSPGVMLSEHLPMLARQAHHLALVNSIGASVSTNDHHAGYYYNLTGHVPDPTFLQLGNSRTPYADDWPFMGAVVGSRRAPHSQLTNAITLPHMEGAPAYTRPGQFSARLGVEYDPLYINGSLDAPLRFQAPALALEGDVTTDRLNHRRDLLQHLDSARRLFDERGRLTTWNQQQERALSLLMSPRTTAAFQVADEPESVRARYGHGINGTSLLLARRLVEAGVPFITVFWKGDEKAAELRKCASGGGWDTHGNNFGCLKDDLLPQFDRGFSALIEDLSDRGLLEQTLLMVTSEMGRKPKIGDPRSGGPSGAGRDHWTHCLTDVLAGGGILGGQTFGSSDRYGEYPQNKPVTPADVTKTVYHLMGIDNLQAFDSQNRPYNLLEQGTPISDLL